MGYRHDWEEMHSEWTNVRGVEEDGCVLVRPDRFVAWRAQSLTGDEDHCTRVIEEVLEKILGRA
jgi:hypothetical protein